MYHSGQDSKKPLDYFFKNTIQPKCLELLKTHPDVVKNSSIEQILKQTQEVYTQISGNPEKHKIIPQIIENFYPNNENKMIKAIKSKYKPQEYISLLNPDIIKYYEQTDKSEILANNVKNSINEKVFKHPNCTVTKEKSDSIIADLGLCYKYINNCIEKNTQYTEICNKFGITNGIENSINHLNNMQQLNNTPNLDFGDKDSKVKTLTSGTQQQKNTKTNITKSIKDIAKNIGSKARYMITTNNLFDSTNLPKKPPSNKGFKGSKIIKGETRGGGFSR